MEIGEIVAQNVRRYREARGISQRALGKKFDSSGAHVNRIEAGDIQNVGISTLAGVAKALNVTLCDLVQDAGPQDDAGEGVSDQALRIAALLRDADLKNPEAFLERLVKLPPDEQLLIDRLVFAVESVYRDKTKRARKFRLQDANLTEKLNIMGRVAENGNDYEVDTNKKE